MFFNFVNSFFSDISKDISENLRNQRDKTLNNYIDPQITQICAEKNILLSDAILQTTTLKWSHPTYIFIKFDAYSRF